MNEAAFALATQVGTGLNFPPVLNEMGFKLALSYVKIHCGNNGCALNHIMLEQQPSTAAYTIAIRI